MDSSQIEHGGIVETVSDTVGCG